MRCIFWGSGTWISGADSDAEYPACYMYLPDARSDIHASLVISSIDRMLSRNSDWFFSCHLSSRLGLFRQLLWMYQNRTWVTVSLIWFFALSRVLQTPTPSRRRMSWSVLPNLTDKSHYPVSPWKFCHVCLMFEINISPWALHFLSCASTLESCYFENLIELAPVDPCTCSVAYNDVSVICWILNFNNWSRQWIPQIWGGKTDSETPELSSQTVCYWDVEGGCVGV